MNFVRSGIIILALAIAFSVGRWSNAPSPTDLPESSVVDPRTDLNQTERTDTPTDRGRSLAKLSVIVSQSTRRGWWHPNKAWDDVLHELSPAELSILLDQLRDAPWNEAKQKLSDSIYGRWAQINPQNALTHTRRNLADEYWRFHAESVFEGWAHSDANGLADWTNNQADNELRVMATLALAPHLASEDPAEVFALAIATSTVFGVDDSLVSAAMKTWARTEPQVALAAIEANLRPHQRTGAYAALFGSWAQSDPAAAFSAAHNLSDLSTKTSALFRIAREWAVSDPAQAVEALKSVNLGAKNQDIIAATLGRVATVDPDLALETAKNLPVGAAQDLAILEIATAISQTDPELGAMIAASLPEGLYLQTTAVGIAENYARTDPENAFAWARNLPEGSARKSALEHVTKTIAREDTSKVLSLINRLPTGTLRKDLLTRVIDSVATFNPPMAFAIMNENAGVIDFPQSAMVTAISHAAAFDPDWLLANRSRFQTRELNDQATAAAIGQISQFDPARAAELLSQQPQLNDDTIWAQSSQIVENWARTDPVRAAEWIDQTARIEHRQDLLRDFIHIASGNSPALAASLLPKIENRNHRFALARAVERSWRRIDSDAAEAWREENDLAH
ncbi:MAG: hypothetical protein SynsKO_07610 [Synoicihabitans sp.]